MAALEEQFRRMLFNLVARNQDDHVKNIAFQMTVNGKRDGFVREERESASFAIVRNAARI